MKFLITGGAGSVGQALTSSLLEKGYFVRVLDKRIDPLQPMKHRNLELIQGGIEDLSIVKEAAKGIDIVVHLAWSFSDSPRQIFDEDIKGHINLLEAASAFQIKSFIYISTATVYGRAAFHPVFESHPCLIGEARKPLYALGKYTAEELCCFYHKKYGLPAVVLRFWWAFGETISGSHLRDLIIKALNNQPIELVIGAGGAFLTMEDFRRAIMLTASKPAASGHIYNLGSLFLTWEEIVKIVLRLTGSISPIHFIPSDQWQGPAFLNEVWDLDWGKGERELGFMPMDSMEIVLSRFTEALKNCIVAIQKEKEPKG